MTERTEKQYLSPTQLDMFCRCAEQYRRRYIEGEKLPPGIAMLKGSGFHQGAAVNMRQKIESHQDLPPSQIVDAATAAFEAAAHGDVMLTHEEAGRGSQIVIGEATDSLVGMAHCHAKKQAPEYQPVIVEHKIRVELPTAPRDLLGIIDLADDQDRVVDFKTAGRKKSQGDVDSSVQLTTYAAAYHAHTGHEPSEVRLDTVVQTKTKTDRQALSSARGPLDFAALCHRINTVAAAIEAGSFPPVDPGHWVCDPKWCGYFRTCQFVNPSRGRPRAQGD
jgi:hypothetical protein